MTNQIALSGFESPGYSESLFLDSIFPRLTAAVEAHGGSSALLTRKATQVGSKSSGYSAVFFGALTAFRLRFRGKQHYISLSAAFTDLVPDSFPKSQLASEPKYIRIFVDPDRPLEDYTDLLIAVVVACVNRYPTGWDCCSRYMECSNAKACTHPDKVFALECGYRKVLNSGRIFYGENRNID